MQKKEKKVAILMDKLLRIEKVAEFCEINFREWAILDFSQDKLSQKRAKFATLAKANLAKINPVKIDVMWMHRNSSIINSQKWELQAHI